MAGLVIPMQCVRGCRRRGRRASHTLNVIPKDLAMALGTALSEALEKEEVNHIVVKVKGKRNTFPPLPRPDIVFKGVGGR